ncbi:MAG: DUF3568 family protein [Planctomycetota bacterium]|nr:DUF3568 family protein [Planctomycetota bacterium]
MLLSASLIVQSSCAPPVLFATLGSTAVEATAGAFVNGELIVAERAELSAVYEAALLAMDELAFKVDRKALRERTAAIYSRTTDNASIEIKIARKSPVVTRMDVRVGVLGDQPLSELIITTMRSHLRRHSAAARQAPLQLPPNPSLLHQAPLRAPDATTDNQSGERR